MEHTEIIDVLENHTQITDIVNIIPSKWFLEIIITFIAFIVLLFLVPFANFNIVVVSKQAV